MNNSGENVFDGIPVGPDEASFLNQFLDAHDFAKGSRRGFVLDLRKFARWFSIGQPGTVRRRPGDDQGRYGFQGLPSS